jgi:predicted nucleic acid-binding protein
MAKIERRYWDACTFIAYLGDEPRAGEAEAVLRVAERGHVHIVTSALTLAEVLKPDGHKPITVEQQDKIDRFFHHTYIKVRNVDRKTAELARRVFWKCGIEPKDAVHVATALMTDVDHLETFDGKLLARSGLEVDGYGPLSIREPMVDQPELEF